MLKRILLFFFILISFNFFLMPHAHALSFQASSLRGLATMREMAQASMGYQEALSSRKPTLLEFYADWCTTCQGMAPIINNLEQEYKDEINLVMLNIDDPQWQEIIKEYKVTGVPQFTFLDPDRQMIDTLIGKVPKQVMTKIFQQMTS